MVEAVNELRSMTARCSRWRQHERHHQSAIMAARRNAGYMRSSRRIRNRTKFQCRERVGWAFTFAASAFTYFWSIFTKLLGASAKAAANCRLIEAVGAVLVSFQAGSLGSSSCALSGPATMTITAQGGVIAFGM